MWICFIYTIKERCKLCGYVLYIQLRKGVQLSKGCKLCGYVLYIQLRKGVSCVDMFYIYN